MTTKWDEQATKVDRFWCDEASNIRCVREADYDALLQRLNETLEKHRSTFTQLEQKERDCEELRKDAERYRFLKDHGHFRAMSMDMGGNHSWTGMGRNVGKGPRVDEAIDVARAKESAQ